MPAGRPRQRPSRRRGSLRNIHRPRRPWSPFPGGTHVDLHCMPGGTATAGHVVPAPTWPRRRLSLWLCRDGLRCCERRVLALEGLDRTAAPAFGQGLRRGIGEDVFLSVLHPVEDGPRDGLRRGLGYVEAPGHVG